MLPKTYFLLIPAIFLASFLYLPTFFNYITAEDGRYSEWTSWSRCMKYCGESWQGRYRNCSKESKGYGKTCESLGPRIETKKCFLRECPIDGHPGAWENWGPCDKDCKDGKRSRKRICNNPRPKYFGLPCQEAMKEFQKCPNEKPCKEDGKYGWWSKWSECSANCGKGTQTRERKCTPPVGGGKPCEKGSVEKVTGDCFIKDCATEKPKVTPTKKTETTKKVENNAVATKKT